LDFFEKKGHKIVPSSSLIPDDPSVLLTTAGMQQFKKYFTGELDPMKDFGGKNTVSIQKCFRTSDIDEVGDESHLTFFEMLGNFSFGGYWKKEAIEYAYEFIRKEMGLEIDYVSVFKGDKEIPADEESEKVWKSLGISEIKKLGREDNFWGPTGSEGPCGPTTEIYINGVEIWNIVFNEYYSKDGKLMPLKIKGVDTGMGLERLATASQNVSNIFDTDLFTPIMNKIKDLTESRSVRESRIIADHIRTSVFIIGDGVIPSNADRGYVLRRLLRRAIRYADVIGIPEFELSNIGQVVQDCYKTTYPSVSSTNIGIVINDEEKRFRKTLEKGLLKIDEFGIDEFGHLRDITGAQAFELFSTYGFPLELTKEIISPCVLVDFESFETAFKKHQEISRAGNEKKFGGHGLILNTGELKAGNEEELKKVTRLHTATHLLQKALREVLGKEVEQRGSDITSERTRFDFSFSRKLTPEEIKKVEGLVNQKIKEDSPVNFKEMSKSEAEKTGALYFFREKYPEKVKVYFVGESLENAWSKEFCGGPHVNRTSEIGEFRILKEEAVAAGVRRIRAAVL